MPRLRTGVGVMQKLPSFPDDKRAETGPMQFGDDWPGIFIRGDNALWMSAMLETIIPMIPEDKWVERSSLDSIKELLRSCGVRHDD